jgi:Iap family predicted aminopeptidase
MLRRIVRAISSVGSHPLGFRAAGTHEEHAVAEVVAAEMRTIGLADVHFEQVPVHAWRLLDASVAVAGGRRYAAASMASVPPTRGKGVTGEVVFVGDGRRDRLDRLDLQGKIALVAWKRATPWISTIGLELGRRGAVAIILASLEGAPRFVGERALGTSVGLWHDGAPPLVTIREADARELLTLCRAGRPTATVRLDVQINRRARGRNVCGVLHPALPGAPLVVGAHHDGWFYGAFDNASGVASMLTIAKGLIKAGGRPSRPVWFVSHTAEEYGRMDDDLPWCWGAWHQVAVEHRDWGAKVPFYLDIEASGRSEFPLVVVGPAELRRLASRWCRSAADAGFLPRGWKFEKPTTGTHQWPFQLAGVPGLSVLNWHNDFARTDYHTDRDTYARMDFGHLADLSRLYAAILIDAQARAEHLLDHRARARDVAKAAKALPDHEALTRAADEYGRRGTRRAFARLARAGFAVDATGEPGYLYEQAARDTRRLAAAIRAIDANDPRGAARAAAKVGANGMQRWASEATQQTAERRHDTGRVSWPAKSHLTRSPHLWREIASLRGEPGARPFGPWVRQSLERHHERMRAETRRRVARLVSALAGGSR